MLVWDVLERVLRRIAAGLDEPVDAPVPADALHLLLTRCLRLRGPDIASSRMICMRHMGAYYVGAFKPALVQIRKVGALTFDASNLNDATVSYTVDGTPVVKNVTRPTWGYENLSGTYDAVWRDGCLPGDWHVGPLDGFSSTVIRRTADNAVTMTVTYPFY